MNMLDYLPMNLRPVLARVLVLFIGSLICCLAFGCQQRPRPELKKGLLPVQKIQVKKMVQGLNSTSQGLKSWKDLKKPLKRSLAYVSSHSAKSTAFYLQDEPVSWLDLKDTLRMLLDLLPVLDREPELLARHFEFYRLKPDPLFTGYFEPQLKAALEPGPDYDYPIYGVPKDLKKANLGDFHPRWQGQKLIYRIENGEIKPYFDREKIDRYEAIKEKAPILAWAKDPVEVFFLQIQGSGRLLLKNGTVQRVGYAGKNGRRYVSLGRKMLEKKHLSPGQMSMQSIKKYLQEHPELVPEILFVNPSYVFFEKRNGGPYGAMGQELTPLVSLAVDKDILPLGCILAFSTELSGRNETESRQVQGIGLGQDVGGAIKGNHLDLFCGAGEKAAYWAGHLKTKGDVYLLLPKKRVKLKVAEN